MAKIAIATTGQQAQSLKFETPLKNLEVKISDSADAATSFADFYNAIKNTTIEVLKQSKGSTVTVLQRASIVELFQLAQCNGGIVYCENDDKNNSIESAIEVSDYGAVPLDEGEFFEINVFNFPAAAGHAYTIELYGQDFQDLSKMHNVYEKAYVNAESPREIDVRDVKTLVIPASKFEKMEVLYSNGRRIQYDEIDILSRMRDTMFTRSILNTKTDGVWSSAVNTVGELLVFNTIAAISVKITTNENVNITVLKHKPL
jgi:hypothetical protein